MAVVALGCGGREDGAGSGSASKTTSSQSSSASSSSDSSGPLPTCSVDGFGLPPILVDGVECYRGASPTGQCDGAGAACSYCALPVLCSPTYGPRSFYTCSCALGSWSCSLTSQDDGACVVPADAGSDASSVDGGAATDAATAEDAALDGPAVASDGAVCGAGEILCTFPCCSPGCSGESVCAPGPDCPPPPPCAPPK